MPRAYQGSIGSTTRMLGVVRTERLVTIRGGHVVERKVVIGRRFMHRFEFAPLNGSFLAQFIMTNVGLIGMQSFWVSPARNV
jgi:hypothetical protein